jgi:hypothetical protein
MAILLFLGTPMYVSALFVAIFPGILLFVGKEYSKRLRNVLNDTLIRLGVRKRGNTKQSFFVFPLQNPGSDLKKTH